MAAFIFIGFFLLIILVVLGIFIHQITTLVQRTEEPKPTIYIKRVMPNGKTMYVEVDGIDEKEISSYFEEGWVKIDYSEYLINSRRNMR